MVLVSSVVMCKEKIVLLWSYPISIVAPVLEERVEEEVVVIRCQA